MVQSGTTKRAVPESAAWSRDQRVLRTAATLFAIAVLVHNLDHVRRGSDSLDGDVFVIGTLAIVIEVAVVVMVFMRHPLAPITAAVAGFSLALGYVFVHLTPERGWLSDSFLGGAGALLSWGAASLEIIAALALGATGAHVLRRSAWQPAGDGVWSAVRHPVVAVFIVGNVLIVALSLAGV